MKRKVITILLCVLLGAVAVYSGYQVVTILADYKAGTEAYNDLQQMVQMPPAPEQKETTAPAQTQPEATGQTQAAEQPEETLPPKPERIWPEVDFEALHKIDPNVVGWMYLEGTQINYPIAQAEDNVWYLHRLINGEYNYAGTPFMDWRNKGDFTDRNTVVYGHNMVNGTMFADLHKYTDQEFYDEHPVLLLMTPQGNYEVELFAGYVTNLNANAWQMEFSGEENFAEWLEEAQGKSLFTSDVVPTVQDRVLTLSTCSQSSQKTRFVLLGVIR